MGRMMVLSFPLDGGDSGDAEEREAIYAFEDALAARLDTVKGAFLDGHEFGGSAARLFVLAETEKAAERALKLARDLAGDVPFDVEGFDDDED